MRIVPLGILLIVGCSRAPARSSHATFAASSAKPTASASPLPAASSVLSSSGWTAEQQAAHALSRLAFGPRPGQVAALAASGVEPWIRQQLAPAKPSASVTAKLAGLPSAKLTTEELLEAYPKKKQGGGDKSGSPADLAREAVAAKLIRAVDSDRQLEEVLVDFWFNHFNVDANKGAVKWMVEPYERDAIRPHVFGKFRDLLGATAKHPAMLFYLDNWLSTGEAGTTKKAGKKAGLNENYGRELLELHTLGVDGGYGQDDVREVARAFTGWSIDKPRELAVFAFHAGRHDTGPKLVLGTTLDAGGLADGERVLDAVALHPSTAKGSRINNQS